MESLLYSRSLWTPDFPNVIIHVPLSKRDQHPSYHQAKTGNAEAAMQLVDDLINDDALAQLKVLVGNRKPILATISAIETGGFNAIPDAISDQIEDKLGWPKESGEIRQINKVGHTRASGWHRLVTQAVFAGQVQDGADYVLVDDHVGFGGTLANLKGYIESQGGRVLAMTTLTETEKARRIAPCEKTLELLQITHGRPLEDVWHKTFGYGLEYCTELEAGYLCRQRHVDYIRRCLAKAAEKARQRSLQTAEIFQN